MKRAALLALLGLSCGGGSPTQIVLVVDSTFDPGVIDRVQIVVSSPTIGPQMQDIQVASTPFPMMLGISAYHEDMLPTFEIRVTGLNGETEVVRREVRTTFVLGRRLLLRVVLTPTCRTPMCAPGETCDEGGCTSVDVDPSTLVDFDPNNLAPACARRSPERCNGLDDDCDGMADEDFDLTSDRQNCGMCGHTCDGMCMASECVGARIVGVAAGGTHACAWAMGVGAWCWGAAGAGQLGIGTEPHTTGSLDWLVQRQAQPVLQLANVSMLSAGGWVSCAIESSVAHCWGGNLFGQVGDGTTEDVFEPVPVAMLDHSDSVSAGGNHTCAISAGAVWCWGADDRGQLGDPSHAASSMPVRVAVPGTPTVVSAGLAHSCAISETGVWCWGANEAGQLGDATTTDSATPVQVPGLTGALDVAASDRHSCAVASDGHVLCWGDNSVRQCGGDSLDPQPTPTMLGTVNSAEHVRASLASHTCAWGAAGAWCWGNNDRGQLGIDVSDPPVNPAAVPVPEPSASVVSVAPGGSGPPLEGFTCAVYDTGHTYCWGRNTLGEIGNGMSSSLETMPQRVVGLP